jgi:outer membrane lipoprotein-sorting protein
MKMACGIGFVLVLASATARAGDPSGPELLTKVDQAMNNFTDGQFDSKLLIREPGATQAREFAFTTYQKSPGKRLVRFNAPGDVKGMGVLVENPETMYVFLPGFQKIRRVGTHVKAQTFMGSDFAYEDMSQSTYSPTYDAKLVGQDAKTWQLDLTLKPKQEAEFPLLHLWVDKTSLQPVKIEYCDAGGKKLKTQERMGYTLDPGGVHYNPARIVVVDHRRNGHSSEIIFTGSKLNQGLKDDLFTQRSLIRGN